MNHVRADRWYKLGRTILYGTLEDEKAYSSVRRLVTTATIRTSSPTVRVTLAAIRTSSPACSACI